MAVLVKQLVSFVTSAYRIAEFIFVPKTPVSHHWRLIFCVFMVGGLP